MKQELVHIIQTSELNKQNRMGNAVKRLFRFIGVLQLLNKSTSCLLLAIHFRQAVSSFYFNSTRQVSALSALLRWQPPRLSNQSPALHPHCVVSVVHPGSWSVKSENVNPAQRRRDCGGKGGRSTPRCWNRGGEVSRLAYNMPSSWWYWGLARQFEF